MEPTGIRAVIPSTVGVGELFTIKVRVLGPVREIKAAAAYCTHKPRLHGPFNLNEERQIQFVDNLLPEWNGTLVCRGEGLNGQAELKFNNIEQGIFPGDTRPIKIFEGFCWSTPGFHFVEVTDPVSGITTSSNPVYVSETKPVLRLVWGDPHWQTFFSDGIRCPEELYAFARDQAFLDFGAISDHMEAITDRQWDYFQAVTNDYDEPGRFAALIGQEWTHHDKAHGAPGHRNVYYRGDSGPAVRSSDPECNSLEKLWFLLDSCGQTALAIPHHSANTVMGVDWEQGWNPKYEKAVEIYSVWGSSELPASAGNLRPIREESLGGEKDGRHVIDALNKGYRFSFVAGGDIHDGRPGDALHRESYPDRGFEPHDQGLTAAWVPELTREAVFDAMANKATYGTTCSRIYLDVKPAGETLEIAAASEDRIKEAVVMRNGRPVEQILPGNDVRIIEAGYNCGSMKPDEYVYVRVVTEQENMAWSTPIWGNELDGDR